MCQQCPKLDKWSDAQNMSLSLSKCEAIVFPAGQANPKPKIVIGDHQLELKSEIKYLAWQKTQMEKTQRRNSS